MAILSINIGVTGLVGSTVNPRKNTLITTDSLAKITTAGYLNNENSSGNPIFPTDNFEIIYAYNQSTNVGTFGIFTLTYSQATGFTLVLWENPGNVLLPVVSGDVAIFNGTTGQIKDSGLAPSATSQAFISTNAGSLTPGQVPEFKDANGTLENSGVAVTAIQLSANIKANAVSWAGGTTSHAFTISGLTASSIAIPSIQAQATGTVVIESYVASTNTLTVTFSADPGAMVLNYVAFIAAQ